MLHGWDNFYITAATAGATPIGLLFVVVSVTPLIEAPYYVAAYQQTLAKHVTPPAPLLEALGAIKAAAAAAPGEWQEWYWICIGGYSGIHRHDLLHARALEPGGGARRRGGARRGRGA
jgi:hypothetical protein